MLLLPLYFKAVGGTEKFFKAMKKYMNMKVSISLDFQLQKSLYEKILIDEQMIVTK